MVLLVKLKNPAGKKTEDAVERFESPGQEGESSQEYKSASEQYQSNSPTPAIINTTQHDTALDDLASALQHTQIDASEVNIIKEEDVATLPKERPSVDVLIAPAVLGHRWTRTRSNSFVVERPERIRAVSLGIAALFAKHQSQQERAKSQLDDVISNIASLSVERESNTIQGPLAVHLSQASLSLAQPSSALKTIHALEQEYLSVSDVGQPSPYSSSQMESSSSTSSITDSLPYTSFLDNLCSQAPCDVPPPAPRNMRSRISPNKANEDGFASENRHPSEVPLHLPQGDLYLCGPQIQNKSDYFAQSSPASSDQTSQLELPHTPKAIAQDLPAHQGQDGEAHWQKGGSRSAIEAALGTGCAAIDRVVSASLSIKAEKNLSVKKVNLSHLQKSGTAETNSTVDDHESEPALRSFVLVRPPGHHCNATQPSGFCWVNNVAVMAAHAYHQHGIDRVAILDFDLHHGNGTQAIAWRINAETVRHDLELEAKEKMMRAEQEKKSRKQRRSGGGSGEIHQVQDQQQPESHGKRGLKIFYGSLHDIESFPCEDGNKELVTDASVCIEGAHGQWIWNVHLDASTSVEESQRLYNAKYSQLMTKARNFFAQTESSAKTSLVLISAGFDACTHEQPGMQRHGKSVPPQFYEVFTKDAVKMANEWCAGKCVSILEGGYSDRALTSGAIAHLIGLGVPGIANDLYQPSNLYQLEKVAKMASSSVQQRRRNQNDALSKDSIWLDYTLEAIRRLEEMCGKKRIETTTTIAPVTPTRVMLDELWKSPRETRNGRGANSEKASPAK